MNINKEEAVRMLAEGIPTGQIAAALGVDPSYISQLKDDPDIQDRIQELAATKTATDMAFDDMLMSAEQKALERIDKNMHFANMGQSLHAFKILNAAKKRRDGIGGQSTGTAVPVTLVMPIQATINFTMNARNEIVEVEGKTMLSATVRSLDAILAARAAANPLLPATTDMEKAAQYLDVLGAPAIKAMRRPALRLPAELSADIL